MKISINTSTLEPMLDWLKKRKINGFGDKEELITILSLPDYEVEFARYGDDNLPVCLITKAEAYDFFLHFDEKSFSNQRLESKRKSFLDFYENLDKSNELLSKLTTIGEQDITVINDLLTNGLPNNLLDNNDEYKIIFIISIGNSMGWPYENYIDFDIANLHLFDSKNTFLHIVAHEIHHMFFNELFEGNITTSGYFFANFAFEGLAVHYNNNAYTLYKPSKYPGDMIGLNMEDMAMYTRNFDYIFNLIREDHNRVKDKSFDVVNDIIGEHYQQFTFFDADRNQTVNISQYPTYYFGCYLWG